MIFGFFEKFSSGIFPLISTLKRPLNSEQVETLKFGDNSGEGKAPRTQRAGQLLDGDGLGAADDETISGPDSTHRHALVRTRELYVQYFNISGAPSSVPCRDLG